MAILRLRRRSVRRFWFYAALATLFCAFFVASAAGNLPGSPCDMGDGNLVLNDESCDWVNAPNRAVAIDFPSGQTDDSFGQGTKEDTEVPTIVNGSIPPNNTDLTRFYVANESVGTDQFLYLAWERVQEPSFGRNMDFEFNHSTTPSANGVTPVRTAGDLLITYELPLGGTSPTLGYHLWVTTGNPAVVCQARTTVPCWGPVESLAGAFEGSANTVNVIDPIPPDAPRTLSPRTFGEAAINLTLANIFPPGPCGGFAGVYLKSRTTDSFNSSLKDFIAPVPVDLNGCVTPDVATQIHDANENVVTQVPLGATVHDRAVVSAVPPFGTPTGTVGFRWFTNGTCTGTGEAAGTVTLDASGVAHPSQSRVPMASGDYAFRATYSGDSNYNPSTSPCEPLRVTAVPPVTTQIHDEAHNVTTIAAVGAIVHDRAEVSAVPPFGTPTGTVTFTFYTSIDCTTGGTSDGTPVPLVNGVAHPSQSHGPLAAGGYSFRAHYNGEDANYDPADGPCEPLRVFGPCSVGYPYGTPPALASVVFTESEVLRAFAAVPGGGPVAGPNDMVALWYNDEHALTLGVRRVTVRTPGGTTTTDYPVAPMIGNPAHATEPEVGARGSEGTDLATWNATYGYLINGRPMWPALFKTDITADPGDTSGDWQQGGSAAIAPNDIFGTWKAAVRAVHITHNHTKIRVTPDDDPSVRNHWNLGPGSDVPPGGFEQYRDEGYGAEARWNVSDLGLLPGHAYRLYFIVHDGDQNKTGGDSGQGCINVVIPG